MKRDDKVLCLAMVLGDGHVRQNQPELSIGHGAKQKDYIYWKADILSRATGKSVKVSEVSVQDHVGYRLYVTHKFFKVLRDRCYAGSTPIFSRKILNRLTPQALAIWYMDDGSLYAKKRGGKIRAYELCISTCCSEAEAQNVVEYFNSVWDIHFTIKRNKGLCSVRCGTAEARKFLEIVRPYILDCLLYKAEM